VPLAPPTVPVGLPSDLLRRRPDVREAEEALHEATAETGVAVASFFPDVSLSGSVSLQALQFKNLNEFKAITYAFGPEINLPIFEGGELNGQLKLRKAQQQEAAINYAKTVLTAFYQVDTALVAYNQEHETLAQLKIDTQQSQIALGLAEDQYKQGLADYLSVLDAQQSLLSAQQNEAQSVARVSTDLVTLYQALGGGWEPFFPDQTPVTLTASQQSTVQPVQTPEAVQPSQPVQPAATPATPMQAEPAIVSTPVTAPAPALPSPLER
jgi:NodT family efflux transporter outer membrane factor (OMF) lipoprotein